ncbi:MAG: Serine/threonine-protein kinase PknD [Prosthecobacter sp.]|nr:Serine/threonine-protein kinase PknD [Prosthecobacter sp.]
MPDPEPEAQRLEPVPQTEDMPHPSLEELARLLPQYEFHEIVGIGGMGAVYKARQIALDRWVAVKVLPATLAQNAEDVQRFIKEARAMAKLVHPHIVAVFDFGQTHERHLFLVMEYVEGCDLHRRTRQGEVTVERTRQIIAQLCDALQFAHDRGVAHRDIKPANILITNDWKVKVADFGLARDLSAQPNPDEVEYGTPDYTAPERLIIGATVDHRADIYALGVVIHEMLTGKTPAALEGRMGDGLPPGFAEVIAKCLVNEPDARFQKATEVKLALLTATSEGRLNSPAPKTVTGKSSAASTPATQETPALHQPPATYRVPLLTKLRNKLAPLGWAAACILLVAAFASLILRNDPTSENEPVVKAGPTPPIPQPPPQPPTAPPSEEAAKAPSTASTPPPPQAPPQTAAKAAQPMAEARPDETPPAPQTTPFQVADGEAGEVTRLDGHKSAVYATHLLSDQNRVLSTGIDGTVRAWDLTAQKQLWSTDPGIDQLMRLQVSPDDRVIFAYGYKADKMALLDLQTGRVLHTITYPNERLVSAVYLHASGTVIAGGSNEDGLKNLYAWKAAEGGEFQEIEGFTGRVYGMTLAPGQEDVVIASAEPFMNGDRRLYRPALTLYSPAKGTFTKIDPKNLGYVTRFYGPPGIQTVLAAGSTPKVLTLPGFEVLRSLPAPPREGPFIQAGMVIDNGRLLLSAWGDGTLRIHEVGSGEEVWKAALAEPATDIAVSKDGRWAVLSTRYKDSKNQMDGDFDLLVWRLPRASELVSEKSLLEKIAPQMAELEKHDAELAGLRDQLRQSAPLPKASDLDTLKERLDTQYANALRREYPLATPTDQVVIKAELELLGRKEGPPPLESDILLPPVLKKLRSIYRGQLETLARNHAESVKNAILSARSVLDPMVEKRTGSGDKLGALRVRTVLREWTSAIGSKQAADAPGQ